MRLRKYRNRRRDRLINLLRICAEPSQNWPGSLPRCPSVEFTPAHYLGLEESHRVRISHIQVGDEVPALGKWWKHQKKPLAIIRFSNSRSSLAIIPNRKKEGRRIQTKSRVYPGYDFILGFDLSFLDSSDSHILASNHEFLLRNLFSRCHWVTAGPRRKLIWFPYTISYTICDNPTGKCVSFCSRIASRGHGVHIRAFRSDADNGGAKYSKVERLFVSSPGIVPEPPIWAETHGKTEGSQKVRQLVYDALAETIGTNCKYLSVPNPEWGHIFPLPIAPEVVFRELGWVLHPQLPSGEWEYVHQCRVRLTEWGYQGVNYKQPLWPNPTNKVASDKVIQAFQNEWDVKKTKFPLREEWADACQDIVLDTFPLTELPLPEDSESHWLPAEHGEWGRAVSDQRGYPTPNGTK